MQAISAAPTTPPVEIKASQLAEYYGIRWFHIFLMLTMVVVVALLASPVSSAPYMTDAIIIEFGITETQAPLVLSAVWCGSIIGVFMGGRLSDVFGRRLAMMMSALLLMVISWMHLAVPSAAGGFDALIAIRLLVGIPYGMIMSNQVPMIMEFFPDNWRGTAGALSGVGWNLGNLYLLSFIPVAGPATRDWRYYFAFAPVGPGVVALVMLYCLPEGPRWLLTQGRTEEARDSLSIIFASRPIIGSASVGPAPLIDTTDLEKAGAPALSRLSTAKMLNVLFSSNLRWVTVTISLIYLCLAGPSNVAYNWGPQILEGALGESPESHVFRLSEIAGVAGTLVSAVLIDQVPRRGLLLVAFVTTAICYTALCLKNLAGNYVILSWSVRSLLDGILWNIMTPFMSEQFPTFVRGTATGVVMVLGRAASVLMPIWAGIWIIESPQVVFVTSCIMCLLGGLLSMTVPDMTRMPLEDVVFFDDAECMPFASSVSKEYKTDAC